MAKGSLAGDGSGIQAMFLRAPYNYDVVVASDESALVCADKSLAIQSSKDSADINTIVRNFGVGRGAIAPLTEPMFGDFTEVVDFRTAQDALVAARQRFMALPSDLRKRFGNDPQELLRFISDDKNYDEGVKLGFVVPKPVPEAAKPMDVRIVSDPPAAPAAKTS